MGKTHFIMDLLEIIKDKEMDWDDILVEVRKGKIDNQKDIDEYDGQRKQRDSQVGKRPDKVTKAGKKVVPNRIAIPFNKDIVRTSVAFLFGNPVQFTYTDDITDIKNEWRRLRLDQKFMTACEHAKAYRQSALLFKNEETDTGDKYLNAVLLDPTKSDIIPIWDDFGDMQGFAYEIRRDDEDGNEEIVTYLYTSEMLYILTKPVTSSTTELEETIVHGFDRIPVVYIEEDDVEYEDVKPMIDRFENRFSRFADTNDYHGSPNYKTKGDVDALPDKETNEGTAWELPVVETDHGNIIEADVEYLTWDSAPEATKLELELGKGLIYDLSSTPDLSFDNVKGIGTISGIAMELMFLKSIIKAKFSETIYLVAVRRALNLMQLGMGVGPDAINEEIMINFSSILPDHIMEKVELIMNATGGKPIMSQKTGAEQNPTVVDGKEEYNRLVEEQNSGLGESAGL